MAPAACADTHPRALQFASLETNFQLSCLVAFHRVSVNFPVACVPDYDLARAVFTFGNRAFKAAISQWMVFDLHSQPLYRWIEARAFGYCPAFERTVDLKAKIVVQPTRPMFLNNKAGGLRAGSSRSFISRFAIGCFRSSEIALASICAQGVRSFSQGRAFVLRGRPPSGGRVPGRGVWDVLTHAAFFLPALPRGLLVDLLAVFFVARLPAFFAAFVLFVAVEVVVLAARLLAAVLVLAFLAALRAVDPAVSSVFPD